MTRAFPRGRFFARGRRSWSSALHGSSLALAALTSACGPRPGPADGGSPPCASSADCDPGKVCLPDGSCDTCRSDAQCRPRELCDGKTQLCALRAGWGDACQLNSECQAGQVCHQGLCKSQGDVSVCLDPEDPKACPDGQRCNRVNQVCEEDIGCFGDGDCRTVERCNTRTHACELRCTTETQATICAAGFMCAGGRCVECVSNDDCAPGLTCDLEAGRCTTEGRCYTDRDCQCPLVCNRATGTCTTTPPPCSSNEDCLAVERCEVGSGKCLRRACQPDRYEPNDDVTQATGVAPGLYPFLTLCEFEADFYAATLARGDHLDVFIDADPLLRDAMGVQIEDGSARVLARGQLAADTTVSFAGTYYVRITSTDRFVEYALRLIISRGIPCDTDLYEPNDDLPRATRLPSVTGPVPTTGTLTVCPGEVDYFRFDVPSGKSVSIELFHTPSEGDLDLYVYDASGGKLIGQSVTTDSPEKVTVTSAAAGGAAYAKVMSANARVQNQYYLGLTY